MKLILSAVATLVLGVLAGAFFANVEASNSGEFFAPNNALNPTAMAPEEKKRNPEIQVANGEVHNFGQMMLGSTGEHTFQIVNTGGKPLNVRLGETSCKCTFVGGGTVDPEGKKPTVVKPGESVEIQLQWTPKDIAVDFHQSATLETNDPARPNIRLQIRGRVLTTFELLPDFVRLPNINASEGATRDVDLTSVLEADQWDITDVKWQDASTAEFFDVEVLDLPPERIGGANSKSGRLLKLTVKPGLPVGKLKQTLVITTNTESMPEVLCEIDGNVITDITVVGPGYDPVKQLVRLAPFEGKIGGKTTLQLIVKGENHEAIEFEIQDVTPSGVMNVGLGESKSTDKITRVPLSIEFPPGSKPASHRGQINDFGLITLKTNHPTVKEVKVYVSFVVK